MRGYGQLTLAQLRLFWRNKKVLFWTLLFPVFFMLVLGSFLGNANSTTVEAVVIDQDGSPTSKNLAGKFGDVQGLHVKEANDLAGAKKLLEKGDTQLIVVIPKGYGEWSISKEKKQENPQKVILYYDETKINTSQLGLSVMNQVIDGISKQMTGYRPVLVADSTPLRSLDLGYIDFLVPGIVAMMIMSNNMNGVAGQIASWRERGILRRMQTTTLAPGAFIAAQITSRLLLNGIQALILILIGYFVFGTQVNGSWLLLIFFIILGTLTFMSIGFIIASLAKDPEQAGPMAGFLSFPMMFLGGVFFPISSMPDFLQGVVQVIPITHLTTAIRAIMNLGAGFQELWISGIVLAGWAIVAFTVSALTFKWE